jgi:myosin heavy chain 6/7
VYRVCSAIVHMGETKFKERQEQAELDGEDGLLHTQTHKQIFVEAKKCAAMFGVDVEKFILAQCKPRVKVGTEWVNKGQNCEQVQRLEFYF